MQWLKRLLSCAAALMMGLSSASAEVRLLPQLDVWSLTHYPLDITLSADVAVQMPFDETRTQQLNALMKHLTMRLRYQQLQEEAWSGVAIDVDGTTAVELLMRQGVSDAELQLSSQPDRTYQVPADSDPATLLLGEESTSVSFAGLDGSEIAWLTDAYDVINGLNVALSPYGTEKSVKTAIDKMGTARTKTTYAVPAEDAAKLTDLLPGLCVAGELQSLLSSLTFSGKQQFVVYCAESGAILKVTYSGKCGVDEEHLRTVTLSWSLRRDDDNTRDTFSLKSPAVKGTDRNTVTFTRVETAKENGTVSLDASFKHESVLDKVKNTVTATADLTSAPQDGGTLLTGEISIKHTPADEDDKTQLVLTPELTLASSDDAPSIQGTVGVKTLAGSSLKRVTGQITVSVALQTGEYFDWELRETTVALDALSETQLQTVQQAAADAVASDLIRPLVLLPYEDTLFLSADLDEASWQTIVDAARDALE